jgi:hypothetical protein
MKRYIIVLLVIFPIITFSQDHVYKRIFFKTDFGINIYPKQHVNDLTYENIDATKRYESTVYLGYRINRKNTLDLGLTFGEALPLSINWVHYLKNKDNTIFYKLGFAHNVLFYEVLNYNKYIFDLGYRFKFNKRAKRRFAVSLGYNWHTVINEADASSFTCKIGYNF